MGFEVAASHGLAGSLGREEEGGIADWVGGRRWGWFGGGRQSRTGGEPGERGGGGNSELGRWSGVGVVSRAPPVRDWRGAWGERRRGEQRIG